MGHLVSWTLKIIILENEIGRVGHQVEDVLNNLVKLGNGSSSVLALILHCVTVHHSFSLSSLSLTPPHVLYVTIPH